MFVYFVSVNPLTFYLDSPPEIGVILKMKLWSRQGPFICLPMTLTRKSKWMDGQMQAQTLNSHCGYYVVLTGSWLDNKNCLKLVFKSTIHSIHFFLMSLKLFNFYGFYVSLPENMVHHWTSDTILMCIKPISLLPFPVPVISSALWELLCLFLPNIAHCSTPETQSNNCEHMAYDIQTGSAVKPTQ